MKLENTAFSLVLDAGRITQFVEKRAPQINLADHKGKCGLACFTLQEEDVRTPPHEVHIPYTEHYSAYTKCVQEGENRICCKDPENGITTEYRLEEDGLVITAQTDNTGISGFGIHLDLNFLGKKGTPFREQILPSSPYTSEDGKFTYCIMTRPNGRFMVASAMTRCDGWRICYSPFACGHYTWSFQFLASFDRLYGGSGSKYISVKLQCVDTLEEAYAKVQALYGKPMCTNVVNGGFDGTAQIRVLGQADALRIQAPSGTVREIPTQEKVTMEEYGLHTVTPMRNGEAGLNTTVWNGIDMHKLFDLSCDAVRKPYHCDQNLCEGGCFLWAMLLNMRMHGHRKYDPIVREELAIIMAKGEYVPRRTILPFPHEDKPAYHIYKSGRVQEQFFGVSILMEAYLLYEEEELLEYAIAALKTMVDHNIRDGALYDGHGHEYTTVCCPVIPMVDMALLLKQKQDPRYKIFEDTALAMAEFLYNRGYHFPTEGGDDDLGRVDEHYEDGAISCTALALVYVCSKLHYEQKYVDFADEILQMHRAWTIFTPDARMYRSTFRWWETIWEGDGQGPAICAGHSWTAWRAEALFWLGMLKKDRQILIESWNGFLTCFSKTQADGRMYSCYEADFIRGGGDPDIWPTLDQLTKEDWRIDYSVGHGYPKHPDSSLSRYAWARAAETWMRLKEEDAAWIK